MSSNGKYTLDRFEGNYAVLLYRPDETVIVNAEKDNLPANAKEGDILDVQFAKDGSLKDATILEDETKKAREKAENLLNKLRNKK
ncbi:DUF3006 domain-containing protein [Halobacillus sp. HZG1]|uniref:DUF3006 domain-containing protein n=1 Tax=Halobacillus sp. HZG1 TaxID=3111769 RepID=UPI002DB5669D|nr:DUF3006 domain-containing protein [Halobacillus sp. HZG1]MEC3884617.1 DUF3006 domain-containing protein [Halobacillus sp. HZG1]